MVGFANHIDVKAIEAEAAWEDRDMPTTLYQLLASVATRFPNRNAMTFQLTSGPKDPAETLSWQEFHDQSVQAANLFRSLGVGPTDVVAYLLPNATETALTLIGGGIAGISAAATKFRRRMSPGVMASASASRSMSNSIVSAASGRPAPR